MKIGLIQTQRIGDLVITLPIAQWFIERGHQVVWPVHSVFEPFMSQAEPRVTFLELEPETQTPDNEYFLHRPRKMLEDAACDHIFPLYLHIPEVLNGIIANSLKFDEYKYAQADVPFSQKWKLKLQRDTGREKALYATLGITRPFVLVSGRASNSEVDVSLPPAWLEQYQIVTIDERTDNPFDWLYTIEQASKRVMYDSLFANLVEQLNILGDNYLIFRSVLGATPVFANGWKFCWPGDPIEERQWWSTQDLISRGINI